MDTTHTIIAARTDERPDYLLADLAGLYAPYPEVVSDAGMFRCGAATAVAGGGIVTVTGLEGDLDAWRAACAAWWAAVPDTDVAQTPQLVWRNH
ncbi:hypothetical protein D3C73_1550620 [compost metagenome]